jgi:hypothetical protein
VSPVSLLSSPPSLPPLPLSSFSLPSHNSPPCYYYTGKGGKGGKAKGGGKSTAGGQTIEIKRSKDRLTVRAVLGGKMEERAWREKRPRLCGRNRTEAKSKRYHA